MEVPHTVANSFVVLGVGVAAGVTRVRRRGHSVLADSLLRDLDNMARRREIDAHPGRLPKIRADGETVVFEFDAPGGERGPRLLIRCDGKGEIWAWISTSPETR